MTPVALGRVPFPFVVGCGRSGTTLLRAMLDAHPQLAVPGESHFLEPMIRGRSRYETPEGFAVDAFVEDLQQSERFALWGLSSSAVRNALAEARTPLDLAGAIRALYSLYALRRGKDRYADKTPNHVLSIPLLAEILPESRFIHLIRDGRDVALSLLAVPHWGPSDVATAAARWVQFVEAGRSAGRAMAPERYLEVRYEALVDDPESSLREICTFVELPFDEAMLGYHERVTALLETVSSPEIHTRLALPPTGNLRNWRSEMGLADRTEFEEVAGELLDALGYERALG